MLLNNNTQDEIEYVCQRLSFSEKGNDIMHSYAFLHAIFFDNMIERVYNFFLKVLVVDYFPADYSAYILVNMLNTVHNYHGSVC